MIEADTSELQALTQLFERRAAHLTTDAYREAVARANAVQAAKGPHPGIKHARTIRHRKVLPFATGSMIARMMESVMFRKLADFFGDW